MEQSGPIVFFVGRYSFYNRYSGYLFLFEWVLFISFFQGTGSFELQSVQFSHSFVSDYLQPHALKHARLPCPPPTPRACSNSCPLSWWWHSFISSSIVPFSCLQSFLASGSLPKSQFFTSGGQSIGASASASVLPMNIQHSFPLGWTGLISLQSKGLSKVFFNTAVQKHQFSVLSFLYSPTFTSIHDNWGNKNID